MNIGILGTGSIARTMAAEFAKVPAFRCEAVCSRQQATGEALAQQFGIPKVYTDYDAMLADPDIELVYIATPNSLHYAQTKAALLAGKNVLCEKPFVPTVAEADELIALAKEKHLSSSRPSPRPTTPTMHLQSSTSTTLVLSASSPVPSASIPAGTMPCSPGRCRRYLTRPAAAAR